MKKQARRWLAAILSLMLLCMAVGCGGGGGTPSDVTDTPEDTTASGETTSTTTEQATDADTTASSATGSETTGSETTDSGSKTTGVSTSKESEKTTAATSTSTGGNKTTGTTKESKKTTASTKAPTNNNPLADSVKTWTESALTDVFENTAMPAKASTSGELHMLKNEAESLQVAVRPEGGALNNVSVTVESVSGLSLAVYQIGNIKFSKASALIGDYRRAKPGTELPEYYMNTNTADRIAKGSTVSFCVEAITTAKTKAGTYKTNIVIRSQEGVRKLPLQIKVYNGTLPEPKNSEFDYVCWHLSAGWNNDGASQMHNTFFDINGYDADFWKLQENYAKVMKKERQNVVEVPLRNLLGSGLTIKSDGTYQFDFTNFDRYVETYLKYGSVKYLNGDHLLDKDWYISPNDPSWPTNSTDAWVFVKKNGKVTYEWQFTDSDKAQKHLKQLLPALYKHLKQKGWDKMWIQNVADEVTGMKPKNQVAATYDLVHKLMPTVKTIDAGSQLDIRYGDKLDIPAPRLDDFAKSKEGYAKLQADSATAVWTYTCDGPQGNSMSRLNDFPLISTRALGWYTWQNNVDGYLHWAWNRWNHVTVSGMDPFEDIHCAGGPADGFLVYPDLENTSVLEGTRSTAMRDAVEDNELLRLAAKKNSSEVKKIVDSLIRSYVDFERNPDKYLQARVKLLQMIG